MTLGLSKSSFALADAVIFIHGHRFLKKGTIPQWSKWE
jgi:hypothetical protein